MYFRTWLRAFQAAKHVTSRICLLIRRRDGLIQKENHHVGLIHSTRPNLDQGRGPATYSVVVDSNTKANLISLSLSVITTTTTTTHQMSSQLALPISIQQHFFSSVASEVQVPSMKMESSTAIESVHRAVDWLEEALTRRGLDADLYARCILNLFKTHHVDQIGTLSVP